MAKTKALVKTNSVFEISKDQQYLVDIKTPSNFVVEKPGPGGRALKYVEIGYMRRMLVKYCAGNNLIWSVAVERVGDWGMVKETREVVVRVILSMTDSKGFSVIREFFGSKDLAILTKDSGAKKKGYPVSIGNDYKAAEADGLKKCIASLGIAQDIYEPSVQRKADASSPVIDEAQVNFDPSQPDTFVDKRESTINNKQVAALLTAIKNAKLLMTDVTTWSQKEFSKTEFKTFTPKEFEDTVAFIAKKSRT